MTKTQLQKLRKLFEKQTKYEMLRDIAEHSKAGQEILIKTSNRNKLLTVDIELAKLIGLYADEKLGIIQAELEGV